MRQTFRFETAVVRLFRRRLPEVSVLQQNVPVGGHVGESQARAHARKTVRLRRVHKTVPDQRQPAGAQARARVAGQRRHKGGGRRGRGPGRQPLRRLGGPSAATVPVHVLHETVSHVHGAVEPRARAHPRKAVRVFGVREVFPHQVQHDRAHEGLSRRGRVRSRSFGRGASVHVQDPIGNAPPPPQPPSSDEPGETPRNRVAVVMPTRKSDRRTYPNTHVRGDKFVADKITPPPPSDKFNRVTNVFFF